MSEKPPLTPHQKIMRAAKRGGSLCLTAEDVRYLATDDAIVERAVSDDLGESIDGPRPVKTALERS